MYKRQVYIPSGAFTLEEGDKISVTADSKEDVYKRQSLAKLLKSLLARGLTLFMVSHDIEFCAEYGDTCALFFDGCIASQDPPRRFFGGNSFYTTSANRMSRHLFAEAVTCQDVITLCAMNLTANSSGPESGAPSTPPPSSFC